MNALGNYLDTFELQHRAVSAVAKGNTATAIEALKKRPDPITDAIDNYLDTLELQCRPPSAAPAGKSSIPTGTEASTEKHSTVANCTVIQGEKTHYGGM